ncbi:hypothetical protein GCM10011297_00720 [Bacterioplanes sanyensis]|uniref:hypothetical protein n=1 Tax=Bacterioplanes sanyensis TaxID=1249553 RepID=UPI001679BE8C|nr:hypothetical protein [Bacterioplanes sanyensis]GGY31828.1 hypothetical protein GCM10011297_00720 [Bacterioplanes sanyensis]
MRFIFVDAENIGLKEVEAISASISDKVLVFSKNDAVKEVCERKLFLYISSYPKGSNQADFYIIGNLVGMIASLTEQQRDICQFVLYSQDSSLVTAFTFQCKLHKIKHRIALEPKSQAQTHPKTQVIESEKSLQSLEQRIFEHFKTEQTTESVRKKIKQSKPVFTRALNNLIKENKIQRVSKRKKTWIHANRT